MTKKRINDILIIGHFGFISDRIGGQTIKTRNVYKLIKKFCLVQDHVEYFDTEQLKTEVFKVFSLIKQILKSNTIIYIPAWNNLKYFSPILVLICTLFKKNVLFIPVGGWLNDFLEKFKSHKYILQHVQCIFPQSRDLTEMLTKKYNFKCVETLPNFRIHDHIPVKSNIINSTFKILFLARVTRLKGVDTVFELANYLLVNNLTANDINIDFYGPIDPDYKPHFLNKIEQFNNTNYFGSIQPESIYKTICNYDLMVLPTSHPGEGVPGSIIDAFICGLPVIATRWKYIPEIIQDGYNGFLFDIGNENLLFSNVVKLYHNREILNNLKLNALKSSKEYSCDKAWDVISKHINSK